jgi:hypothetical protein
MNTFIIKDSQYYKTDTDSPPSDWILEALSDVYDKVKSGEDAWICKGSYQFNFWIDKENINTIYCNGFVLKNPDDFNDSSTEDYTYYFEIEDVTKELV